MWTHSSISCLELHYVLCSKLASIMSGESVACIDINGESVKYYASRVQGSGTCGLNIWRTQIVKTSSFQLNSSRTDRAHTLSRFIAEAVRLCGKDCEQHQLRLRGAVLIETHDSSSLDARFVQAMGAYGVPVFTPCALKGSAQSLNDNFERSRHVLVPDFYFLQSGGYSALRQKVRFSDTPWRRKNAKVVWRGSSTGPIITGTSDAELARNSRLALALAAKNPSNSGLDAAIALPIIQLPPHVAEAVEARGLIGANMTQAELMHARGIIDIDGNSNAWTGFFWKLFCKSVTLKVSSSYEQWFYKDLIPWTHYVPVAADLADLHGRVDFVVNRMQNHSQDQQLKQIGEASTALIRSSGAFNHTAIGQRMLRFLGDAWPKLIWENSSGYRRAGSTPPGAGRASVLRQVNTAREFGPWQTGSAELRNYQAFTLTYLNRSVVL